MKTQFEYLKLLAPFQGTRPGLPHLIGIHVEPCETGIILVATDSHAMGVIHDDTGEATAEATYLIPPEVFESEGVEAVIEDDILRLFDNDGHLCGIFLAKQNTARYANWDKGQNWSDWRIAVSEAFKEPEQNARAIFNPEILMRLHGREFYVQVINDRGPALVISRGFDNFFGFVMPLKYETPIIEPPEWMGIEIGKDKS